MEAYEQLKQLVEEAEEDIRKAEGGNKAAGTRARKTMQEVKKAAQSVREAILEIRDDGDSSSSGSGSPPGPTSPLGGPTPPPTFTGS
jgi:hypothetical protein